MKSEPTGEVKEEQMNAMAAAIFSNKTSKMDYRFKNDRPEDHWEN